MSSGSIGTIAGHDTSQVSKGIPRALGKRKKPSGGRSGRVRGLIGAAAEARFRGVLTVLKLLTAGRVMILGNILKILTGAGLERVVLTLGGDYPSI